MKKVHIIIKLGHPSFIGLKNVPILIYYDNLVITYIGSSKLQKSEI